MIIRKSFLWIMCLLSAFGLEEVNSMAAMVDLGGPIGSRVVLVTDSARAKFLEKATSFAEAQGFTVRVAKTRPDGKHFLVEMSRDDIKIVALNPFDDPAEFRVDLYQRGKEVPSQATIDALIE